MKKFLTVLCLALLLTLICTSAMATIDAKYKNNKNTIASMIGKEWNGYFIKAIDTVSVYPTCTAAGTALVQTQIREWDGTAYVPGADGPTLEMSIDPLHSWKYPDWASVPDTEIVDKNCLTIVKRNVCTICGYAETKTFDNPYTGGKHNFVLTPIAGSTATCQKPGLAESICSVCKQKNPDMPGTYEIAKVDHEFTVRKDDVVTTCDLGGKYHYVCKWCGTPEVDSYNQIIYHTTTPHTPIWSTDTKIEPGDEPTCTKNGRSHLYCTLCGAPKRSGSAIDYITDPAIDPTIKALGHDWTEWTVTKAPTCVDGKEERGCLRCGISDTRAIPATDEHTWVEKRVYDMNCYKNPDGSAAPASGMLYTTCSVCGADKAGSPAPFYDADFTHSNHQFVRDTSRAYLNEPAGCVGGADGKEAVKCTVCGGTAVRTVPAKTSHNWSAWKQDEVIKTKWTRKCTNETCSEMQTYIGTTPPKDAVAPTTSTEPAPTSTATTGTENYKITSWSFTGSSVTGQVAGNVSYRTPGLSVNVIIYTPTGTFLAVSSPVDENGKFSVSAGGAVYAVSVQLKDNTKTYQTDGKYV